MFEMGRVNGNRKKRYVSNGPFSKVFANINGQLFEINSCKWQTFKKHDG